MRECIQCLSDKNLGHFDVITTLVKYPNTLETVAFEQMCQRHRKEFESENLIITTMSDAFIMVVGYALAAMITLN